jgi:hypothetical protein
LFHVASLLSIAVEAQFAAAGDLTWSMSGDRHFHVWRLSKRLCLINLFLPYLGLAASITATEYIKSGKNPT